MQSASLSQIKKELNLKSHEELLSVCLRLGRLKRENKELLHYLLFENHDEQGYVAQAKIDIEKGISEINFTSIYFAKKSVRKVLKEVHKRIKFSSNKEIEVELLIFFIRQVLSLKYGWTQNKVMVNLIITQFKKILRAYTTLHEDVQFDYKKEIDDLKAEIAWLKGASNGV